MNKVFKVIWNHATQSWVAVSELTSARGKTKSKTSKLTALSLAVGSAVIGGNALAAVYVNNEAASTAGDGNRLAITTGQENRVASAVASTNAATNFIRIGDVNAPFIRDGQIIIGYQVNNSAYGEAGDVSIGNYAKLGGGGSDSFSTLVGFRTQSAGPSVAIGVGARSDIHNYSGWNGTTQGGVAIGAFALQGGNVDAGVSIGALSASSYTNAVAVGALSGAANQFVDLADDVGYSISEGGSGATSIGHSAGARGTNSTAIGYCATTAQSDSAGAVAVGYNANSIGAGSIAMGQGAVAGGFTTAQVTALTTKRTNLQTVLANIETNLTVAIAANATKSTADTKFHIANLQAAKARTELAISRINADINRTSAESTVSTTTAMAIGFGAKATNLNTTAIGRGASSYAQSSISLGRGSGVTGVNATRGMALGDGAAVTGDSAVNSTAIGAGANIRQNSTNAIAFGTNASVVGDAVGSSNSIAIGNQTAAGNRNARWDERSGRALTFLAAQNATAVGSESIAGGNNSAAFGYKNVINAPNSTTVGFNNTVGSYSGHVVTANVASANYIGLNTHVIGANNNVTANNTMVFGNNIRVTESNRSGGVVIGDNSSLPTNTTAVNSASVNNITYSGFAGNLGGKSTDGTSELASDQGRFVSIGNSTSPRQLKHVAAGRIANDSTDAINGSQLYSLTGVVSNMGVSVANVIGGNAVLNPNGTVSSFSQPLTTTGLGDTEAYTAPTTSATNVSTAITNLNNYVNAGWKIAEGNDIAAKARISPDEQVNFKAGNLASVTVATNATNKGADVTYSVKKGTFDTTTNGTVKANSTEGVVTNTDVATAVNNSGWNTTLSNGTTLNVNPGDQVNYVNGNGTTANVTTTTVGGKDVVSVSYNVNETTGSVKPNGTATVTDGNAFLNASTVANLVNNSAFNVTTAKVDAFAENQEGKANAAVKAGGNITYTAGKNIAISQNGSNFTFSTTKDIEVDSVTANKRVQIGSGDTAVNLTTDLGALQVADKDGNATQITNVEAGTNVMAFNKEGDQLVQVGDKFYVVDPETNEVDFTKESTPATEEELDELAKAKPALKAYVAYSKAASGLADLDNSEQTNALTVADAQRLGWVVSASGNDYADSVTNANEVRFNGSNGISVTGETDEHGVRNINVSIAKGNVEGNTTTGVAAGDTNYVTGDQVAKAINESGWKTNVTNATTGLPETKVVTPGTQVDYVNGNGTTANVTLKDGKVAVSYNVNQTTGSVNPNGTATVTDGNAFLNASTVANLVNNSAFNVTTAKVDAFAENQEGKANAAVKAGGNITYTAGKNIAISQNGSNFTFSTTKDIEVDSVTANKRVQIGSGDTAVNLTTDLGALQVADKDGNATQITNVEAGTNVMAFNKEGDQLVQVGDKFYVVDPETNEVDFTKESTPATEEELDELAKAKPALKAYVAYSKAASGLADLDNSEQTNALTVADAQRLGWVVSASGNDYADSVTNANEVRFNGSNGISVTGETDEHGVRNINVSIAKGNVAGNTTTGVATGDTNYVTGDQVANAINNSGWKTTATKVVDEAGNEIVDANKATAVNPGDSVNYVDGNSTKANVVVTKAADGKETVNVSYDLVTEDHLTPVANDAKSVTKPTNIDAKGKDAATVNDVLNAGWNLQANDEAVDAVTHGNNVNFTSKDGSVKITAKSDGSTSSLDFAVNATSIVNQVAGTISYNKDGKATTNGDGKRIATVGDVANTINNTGWLTNVTDAKGNVTTKVVTPNTQVNYVNGDGTKANVVANSTTGGLDVTFNVKSANPETLTVDGNGVKVNTGSITEATDVAGDANRGKVTVAAGEGNKVATVQNVANAINSASWTVKVADTQEEITTSTANDEGSSVRAGNEITHVAGKNLKVKRDGRNVTYALANDVSVNTVTAQNSIKVGAGNAATTVTTSSAQDGVTEVKLADEAGKATRITNVAAGVKDTDAVNVSQLRNSNAQINQNIAHLNNKVNRMGKDLRAGIAGSNAAAGLPQVYIPGKSMVAAAAGTFKGQSAVAVGYSRASDNGKVILKLQGNANTRGDVGGSVGVGYQW